MVIEKGGNLNLLKKADKTRKKNIKSFPAVIAPFS
jgi:hypothetical protein